MRKLISIITILLLVSVFSSSCSSIGIGKKEKKMITIKMLTESKAKSADLMKHLKEKFPRINFQVTDFETVWSKEFTPHEERIERAREIIAEEKPDFYYGFDPKWYKEDIQLVDLTLLINQEQTQFNEIQQNMIESATNDDGTLYFISATFDREVLFINRALFQKNGVPEPVNPMTFDELRKSAKLINEKNPGLFGYELQQKEWLFTLMQVGRKFLGFKFINDNGQLMIDQPEWRDLAQQLLDDYKSKIMRDEDTRLQKADRKRIALNPGYASDLYSYLSVKATADTLSIVDVPTDPSNPIANPFILTSPFSIVPSSNYIKEIWEVISYLMTEEAALEISNKRLMSGFVTYPGMAPIGDFTIQSFAGKVSGNKINESFFLTQEAYKKMNNAMEEQFQAYIQETSDFDTIWAAIEKGVKEINLDSSNFKSAP